MVHRCWGEVKTRVVADTKTAPQTGYAPVNGLQSSVSFHPEGDRPLNGEAMAATVEAIAGTAMAQDYRAKSPPPDRLQELVDKLGQFDAGFPGWADADIQGIAAPTLLTVGDCDAVRLEHMVWFLGLRGGDGNGDLVGVPASQLAVFPGTTHLFGLARTELVLGAVLSFLDAPLPKVDQPDPPERTRDMARYAGQPPLSSRWTSA